MPKPWRIRLASRLSLVESPLDEVEVAGFVLGDGDGVGGTITVQGEKILPVDCVHHVSLYHVSLYHVVIGSWDNSVSVSKSSSSPVISTRDHVSSGSVPEASRTSQVATITSPLREKRVPIVSLENVLISSQSWFAAFGLIKR